MLHHIARSKQRSPKMSFHVYHMSMPFPFLRFRWQTHKNIVISYQSSQLVALCCIYVVIYGHVSLHTGLYGYILVLDGVKHDKSATHLKNIG